MKPAELQMSVSGLVNLPRGGAISAITTAAKNWNSSPTSYFNTSLLSLVILTLTFKIYQRASSVDTRASASSKPKSVKDLQIKFLSVFWLLRCADWLQGPYFYEVYASKVFNGVPASLALVSKLFLTGFASTALFGPSVGRALDSFGRKKGTVAFSIIYSIGAFSTKSPLLQVLFLGRIMSGIGTSLLFSAPESWLVGEAQKSGDDPDGSYLGETFGLVSGL
jgi:MFS family permease